MNTQKLKVYIPRTKLNEITKPAGPSEYWLTKPNPINTKDSDYVEVEIIPEHLEHWKTHGNYPRQILHG